MLNDLKWSAVEVIFLAKNLGFNGLAWLDIEIILSEYFHPYLIITTYMDIMISKKVYPYLVLVVLCVYVLLPMQLMAVYYIIELLD